MRDNYPISAVTLGGLAGGLKRKGQLDEAYSLNDQAIEMAIEEKHPFLKYYLEAKEDIEKLIAERDSAN